MINLSAIPTSEVLKDLEENERDLRICRLALLQGITHYKNGESIAEWIEKGEEITRAVRAELERRNSNLSSTQSEAKYVLTWMENNYGEFLDRQNTFGCAEDCIQFIKDMLETGRLYETLEIDKIYPVR